MRKKRRDPSSYWEIYCAQHSWAAAKCNAGYGYEKLWSPVTRAVDSTAHGKDRPRARYACIMDRVVGPYNWCYKAGCSLSSSSYQATCFLRHEPCWLSHRRVQFNIVPRETCTIGVCIWPHWGQPFTWRQADLGRRPLALRLSTSYGRGGPFHVKLLVCWKGHLHEHGNFSWKSMSTGCATNTPPTNSVSFSIQH